MADETIITRADFDLSGNVERLRALRAEAKKAQQAMDDLRRKIDTQQRRLRRLNQEARAAALRPTGAGIAQTQGFAGQAGRRANQAAQGILFTLISAEAFNRLTGGSSSLQSAISGGLAGVVSGGAKLGALGLIGGLVTGLIGEAQAIDAKVKELRRQLDEEAKARKERDKKREVDRQAEGRKLLERIRQLEARVLQVSEDRRQAVYRVLASRGA